MPFREPPRVPDADNDELRTYEWDGSDWSQVGSRLSISGLNSPALTTLAEDIVALAENDSLATYGFDGTNWSLVGNALSISDPGFTDVAALNGATIALADEVLNELRTYEWDGSNWSQVGNTYYFPVDISSVGMDTLTSDAIAFTDQGDGNLRTLRWDGESWHEVGITGPDIVSTRPTLAALSHDTVAVSAGGVDTIRTFEFAHRASPNRG